MQVKNCPRCGKLFNEIISPICPVCERAEEEDFQRVKENIEENPASSLQEISEATGISGKKIMQYIKDGRLEITGGMKGELRCESCGKPITRGKFCDVCLIEFTRNINEMFGKNRPESSEPGEKKSGRMYSSLMKKKL